MEIPAILSTLFSGISVKVNAMKYFPQWIIVLSYIWFSPTALIFTIGSFVSFEHRFYIGAALYAFLAFVSFRLLIFIATRNRPAIIFEYVYRDTIRYEPTAIAESAKDLDRSEYVYLLQDVDVTGYCKIGYTINPSRRLYDFGIHLPMTVSVLHIIKTHDMAELEKQLHNHFRNKHINGEWFDLSQEDVDFIQSL